MSGAASARVAVVTASRRRLPALMYSIDEDMEGNMACTCPPSKSVNAGPAPLAGHMGSGPVAGRRHVDLAGIGDELGNSLGWNRRMQRHDVGFASDARDRCDVAHEIEIQFVIECGVDRVRGSHQQ